MCWGWVEVDLATLGPSEPLPTLTQTLLTRAQEQAVLVRLASKRCRHHQYDGRDKGDPMRHGGTTHRQVPLTGPPVQL